MEGDINMDETFDIYEARKVSQLLWSSKKQLLQLWIECVDQCCCENERHPTLPSLDAGLNEIGVSPENIPNIYDAWWTGKCPQRVQATYRNTRPCKELVLLGYPTLSFDPAVCFLDSLETGTRSPSARRSTVRKTTSSSPWERRPPPRRAQSPRNAATGGVPVVLFDVLRRWTPHKVKKVKPHKVKKTLRS